MHAFSHDSLDLIIVLGNTIFINKEDSAFAVRLFHNNPWALAPSLSTDSELLVSHAIHLFGEVRDFWQEPGLRLSTFLLRHLVGTVGGSVGRSLKFKNRVFLVVVEAAGQRLSFRRFWKFVSSFRRLKVHGTS